MAQEEARPSRSRCQRAIHGHHNDVEPTPIYLVLRVRLRPPRLERICVLCWNGGLLLPPRLARLLERRLPRMARLIPTHHLVVGNIIGRRSIPSKRARRLRTRHDRHRPRGPTTVCAKPDANAQSKRVQVRRPPDAHATEPVPPSRPPNAPSPPIAPSPPVASTPTPGATANVARADGVW